MDAAIIKAGDEPPRSLPARGGYVLDDEASQGPGAFKADGLLDAASVLYLCEHGHPMDEKAIAFAVKRGVLVVIHTGAFRAWWQHLEKLNILPKTLAHSISGDPRSALQ